MSGGPRRINIPETQRDRRLWRTELTSGMILEEIGTPYPRLADEPQAVLVKGDVGVSEEPDAALEELFPAPKTSELDLMMIPPWPRGTLREHPGDHPRCVTRPLSP